MLSRTSSSLVVQALRGAMAVAFVAMTADVAPGASARPQSQTRRAAPAATPPTSQVAVKLLEQGDAAACGETSQSKWQACRRVARCSPRDVDPDVVNALVDAIEAKARERAGSLCERASCGASKTRSGENHFECKDATRLCLTLAIDSSCARGARSSAARPERSAPQPTDRPEPEPAQRSSAARPPASRDSEAREADTAPDRSAPRGRTRVASESETSPFEAASGPTAGASISAKSLPPFLFPAKAEGLDSGELWYWKAPDGHGNGTQKYAYDLTSARYDDARDSWSECVNDKDGKPKCDRCSNAARNEDCLVYGEKLYAMAAGRVIRCWRNAPENPSPGEPHAGRTSTPPRIGGGGNALVIEHDDGTVALYAHMQPGTIPQALCPHNGVLMDDAGDKSEVEVPEAQQAQVQPGQFLGKVGNSGKSSNPHVHVHVSNGGSGVPLNFQGAMLADAVEPKALDWLRLKGNTRPTETSVIWPDFSKGLKEIAYHGVRSESYQDLFDHAGGSGYQLEWIDGFELDGRVRFNVIFRPKSAGWAAVHNLSGDQYQAEYDKRKADGFRLRHVDSYTAKGAVLYAAVFVKDGGPAVAAYHGRSAEQHQQLFDEWSAKGWRARNVSVVSVGGQRVYTALYDTSGPEVRLKSALTTAEYQKEFTDNKEAGLHLAYVNAYTHQGRTFYSAIWTRAAGGGLVARHGMSGSEYQSQWEDARRDGLLTRAVSGSEAGGRAAYVAFWQE
jgi:hypothetical protein